MHQITGEMRCCQARADMSGKEGYQANLVGVHRVTDDTCWCQAGGISGNILTSRQASLKVRLPLLQVSNKLQLCSPLLGICNLLLHIFVLLDQIC